MASSTCTASRRARSTRESASFLASGGSAELDEDDGYTLLTFARRSVLGVMRGHEDASLDEARAASGAGMWVPIATPDGPALAMDTAFGYPRSR